MKNKILLFTIAAVGALLITASNGFSDTGYGQNVDAACTPATPSPSCSFCHLSDRKASTPAKTAYKAGGTTLTDYFCPDPTPTCANDNDGDGYLGEPGNTSCADCDDGDTSVNPDATEDCVDGRDNDCNGAVDCDDSYCAGDPACWLVNCVDYNNPKDRVGCKNDPNCNWSGKNGCSEIDPAQLACQEDGGRWNKKKETCR